MARKRMEAGTEAEGTEVEGRLEERRVAEAKVAKARVLNVIAGEKTEKTEKERALRREKTKEVEEKRMEASIDPDHRSLPKTNSHAATFWH